MVDTSYDVITLWHVLEHLPDLEQVMNQLKYLLAPGGVLIIAVPNFDAYEATVFNEYWAAYDVPRHLSHFTQKSINGLFGKYNFELQNIKPMKFDSYYVSMLSEKYRSGKIKYVTAVWNGFKSNFSDLFARMMGWFIHFSGLQIK